ncbi:MAG TPA: CPBP family intramembrane metalloprotease [Flavobacteriia bacterium]|nr:CPBP family intramembrane metalloprotease [Flavobacteriia bacterium]
MRKILIYLKEFIQKDFNVKVYLSTFLLVAILLFFNYKLDFEDSYIDAYYGKPIRMFFFFLFEGIPYFLTLLLIYFFTENKKFLKNKKFWLLSILGFAILGINRGFYWQNDLAKLISNPYTFKFTKRVLANLKEIVTVLIPFWLIYKFLLKDEMPHFYGIQKKNVNLKPYIIMIFIMVPFLYLASLQPDFLKMYPRYKNSGGNYIENHYHINKSIIIGIYEISYAFSFFIVELIFRGFFIFALVHYLGKSVVLPMAVSYCILHFGKPLGEAISSFFGGYLLGVIAYKTQNIYGGILVHIAIALLMELFAFIH